MEKEALIKYQEQLTEKVESEVNKFITDLLQLTPLDVIEFYDKIAFFYNIETYVQNVEFEEIFYVILLSKENLCEWLYETSRYLDDDHAMVFIEEVFDEAWLFANPVKDKEENDDQTC